MGLSTLDAPVDPSHGKRAMIKREYLDRIPLFRGFSSPEKDAISRLDGAQFIRFEDQEYIIHEGDHDDSFFILLKGNANVFKSPFDDPVATLKGGEIFGEIAFLSPRTRTATIRASGDVFALRFNRAMLQHLACDLREKIKDRLVVVLIEHLDDLRQSLQNRLDSITVKNPTPTWWDEEESENRKKAEPKPEEAGEIEQILSQLPGTEGEITETGDSPPTAPPGEVHTVLYQGKDGYRIVHRGGLSAILENHKKQKFVEMVELSKDIPKNFIKAIESIGHDPKEYLYGDNYVIPAAAKQVWAQTLTLARSKMLEQKQKEDRFQKIDMLYM